MPRGIGNDKFALFRRKITISHINGNALFAFGLQAIHQQGQVQFSPCVPIRLLSVCSVELIFVDLAGIMQQATD